MTLAETAASVLKSISLPAAGLASQSPVNLVWSTVVGNRINCTGRCWDVASVPLGTANPSSGNLATATTVPDGLGGWHVVQMVSE